MSVTTMSWSEALQTTFIMRRMGIKTADFFYLSQSKIPHLRTELTALGNNYYSLLAVLLADQSKVSVHNGR